VPWQISPEIPKCRKKNGKEKRGGNNVMPTTESRVHFKTRSKRETETTKKGNMKTFANLWGNKAKGNKSVERGGKVS